MSHPLSGFRSQAVLRRELTPSSIPIYASFVLYLVALLTGPRCLAQDYSSDHWYTLNAGGGGTPIVGDSNSFNAGWNVTAGAGFRTSHRPTPEHKWSVFLLNVNFMYDRLAIKQSALQQASILNPTNLGLQEATSGRAKFYTTTLDPMFRYWLSPKVDLHVFGGFGWFHRTLEFTGVANEGALLQPNSPVVFGSGGSSGGYDGGAGMDFALPRGMMFYADFRVVHGISINSSTTLLPISAGIRWGTH
jgi:hypothetical protein